MAEEQRKTAPEVGERVTFTLRSGGSRTRTIRNLEIIVDEVRDGVAYGRVPRGGVRAKRHAVPVAELHEYGGRDGVASAIMAVRAAAGLDDPPPWKP